MKSKYIKRFIQTLLAFVLVLLFAVACKQEVNVSVSDSVYDAEAEDKEEEDKEEASKVENETEENEANELPKIKIEMENGGVMVFELYPEYAPETVENFLGLVESGFYDGLKFHRIIKGFMAQSGDPLGNGTGGSGTNIKGEFSKNGFTQNTLKHSKGVLSMARSSDPDSASSQFFLMDGDAPHLDGSYAAFGKLIEGEDVLDSITATEVELSPQGEMSSPKTDVIIKSITVQ